MHNTRRVNRHDTVSRMPSANNVMRMLRRTLPNTPITAPRSIETSLVTFDIKCPARSRSKYDSGKSRMCAYTSRRIRYNTRCSRYSVK